jgi:hypothetical protein
MIRNARLQLLLAILLNTMAATDAQVVPREHVLGPRG